MFLWRYSERAGNPLSQLTRITVAGGSTYADLEYRYSASQNNGRITQLKNWVSGEEVNYQYDALQRLSSAATTGSEWGHNFSYDGFGNKTVRMVTKGAAGDERSVRSRDEPDDGGAARRQWECAGYDGYGV